MKKWKAGQRVKQFVTDFIKKKLKLKVNQEKREVDRPWKRKFLGITFSWDKKIADVHVESVEITANEGKETYSTRCSKALGV